MLNIHTHITHQGQQELLNLYQDFEKSLELRACSIGLHPWYLEQAEEQWGRMQEYAALPQVKAIGECGLDKICTSPWDRQLHFFTLQVELANTCAKPLIIHCVRAYDACLQVLQAARVPVIFHGFNKSYETAESLLRRGYYLSFGKQLFLDRYADTFRRIPADRIFLETDNDPHLCIKDVYKRAAELRNFPLDTLILQIEKNYQNIL